MKKKIAIAGAGFAGAVLARELADSGRFRVEVFDERSHPAGNCHTVRDERTQVMLHEYGPHIFHTSDEEVWKYVNRFGAFGQYVNRVKAVTEGGVYSLPINLLTINQMFGKRFSPAEAEAFVSSLGDKSIEAPRNFEEQALKMMGRRLYEAFFYGYTKKQWGIEPTELPASILQRLPMRFSYDDNYYVSRYQGIPVDGYTKIVERILEHPDIELHLGRRIGRETKSRYDHLFYSGPMDGYFGFSLGRLKYRSIVFERFEGEGDIQGNPVLNYCEESVPYTRVAEHKHFAPWEKHDRSVCFREFSRATGEQDVPYYPMRLSGDKALLEKYVKLADSEECLTFIGRLGTYRYLDMHVVIGESLKLSKTCLATPMGAWPKFSAPPLPPAPPEPLRRAA